jgi:hypothetical protein
MADGCHSVTRYQPDCEKIMRMHAQTAMIENGFVHIPETTPWVAEYPHEMSVFPKGKHDDQVDSTAQFLDWFKKPMPYWAIFEYHLRVGSGRGGRGERRTQSQTGHDQPSTVIPPAFRPCAGRRYKWLRRGR